ncbi:putative F-box protein At3g58860 [Phragmites australis]|uniref:putative F-box protein At3g58860 n=1 Tax=Phragmites australis TaxID=29695 RepID=UPI002D77A8A1|nr:putative F-box protein At3g58860 [Phragmites australis]
MEAAQPPDMEMEEAAGPNPKKRRSDALATEKSPPPATVAAEAPNPQPTPTKMRSTNSQEPSPPGAGGDAGGGGVDRITGLPDAILGDIISLLPTKDAARTQTLASRWRHIWLSAPLNLDFGDLHADDESLAGVISRILSAHPGPGRRFCVPPQHLHDRPATVDAWLRSPALDKLQQLDFWEDRKYSRVRMFRPSPPPASTFRFSATLRVATFCKCHLVDSSVEALHFPQLSQLALEEVNISEGSLHTMISSCPALECLLLNRNSGFGCVRINSNSLRSIGVGAKYFDTPQFRELIIEDAPCLERLLNLQVDVGLFVSVIRAPKLETLCCLTDPSGLVFGGTAIQGVHVVSLTTVMRSVKILAINQQSINLDMVIDLIKCFPCLEKLYIKCCISGEKNLWRRKHRHLIKCLDIRLKTIVLEPYWGINSQVNFASFFVLNARELELMRLGVGSSNYNEVFFAKQHRMLQMEKRASRGARLDFKVKICPHNLLHINHVRDLSITNPFECRY